MTPPNLAHSWMCEKARKSSYRSQPANQDAKAVVPGKKRVGDLGQDSLRRRMTSYEEAALGISGALL
ncbi:hypothetical protein TNCT_672841 [Trichonephila clavata]|uniref:Uncharacterized protein n=1 Tax=Trichonephila clavata TaxID=2740835 RepID=A0A8X6FLU5_TRICU|nr:hypothetical protein TNCT_672841 [Trichonephila clavata]